MYPDNQITPSNQSASHRKQPDCASHLFRKRETRKGTAIRKISADPQKFFPHLFLLADCGKSMSQWTIRSSSLICNRASCKKTGDAQHITTLYGYTLHFRALSDLSPIDTHFFSSFIHEGSPYPEAPPPEHQATPQSHRPTETKLLPEHPRNVSKRFFGIGQGS